MKDNRPFLVNGAQPFGEVKNTTTAYGPCVINGPKGIESKPLGANTQVNCDGHNHAKSLGDQAPGARAKALRNSTNPMAYTGHPSK